MPDYVSHQCCVFIKAVFMLDANSDNYIRGEVQFAYNFKEVTDDQTEGGLVFGNIT